MGDIYQAKISLDHPIFTTPLPFKFTNIFKYITFIIFSSSWENVVWICRFYLESFFFVAFFFRIFSWRPKKQSRTPSAAVISPFLVAKKVQEKTLLYSSFKSWVQSLSYLPFVRSYTLVAIFFVSSVGEAWPFSFSCTCPFSCSNFAIFASAHSSLLPFFRILNWRSVVFLFPKKGLQLVVPIHFLPTNKVKNFHSFMR